MFDDGVASQVFTQSLANALKSCTSDTFRLNSALPAICSLNLDDNFWQIP
jgi:hypothetical protein